MTPAPQQPRTHAVFDELALRLRRMVRDVHVNELSGLERFRVQALTPALVLDQVQGELVLEDGDPDFTVGETLRDRIAAAHVAVGDLVWCGRHDGEWHAFDVVSR